MTDEPRPSHQRRGLLLALAGAFALGAVGGAALLVNIVEQKQEAKNRYVKLVDVTENDVDPAKWGINWPREYDGYKRTSEPAVTKYGGGRRLRGASRPRRRCAIRGSRAIFAGYLFSVDYRDRRGHGFMLTDQENTKRNVPAEAKQSGNCLHCHASIMPLYRKLGREAAPQATDAEQIQKGLSAVGDLGYWDAHKALEQLTGRQGAPGLVRRLPRPAARWSCVSPAPRSSRGSRNSRPARATSRTCRPSSAGARGTGRGPTTRTSTRRDRRSAPTSAPSATWSTSAARGRRSSSRGTRA